VTERILLITDFGSEGPYLGQLRMALSDLPPSVEIVDLMSNAPVMQPRPTAYLLAALMGVVPPNSLVLAVVDPGVGGARQGLVVRAGSHWFVGPDNGLLAIAAGRVADREVWRITWQPPRLAPTFHGRDLFAPVAAQITRGGAVPGVRIEPGSMVGSDWPAELSEIIYLDHYGNAFTGVQARSLDFSARLSVAGQVVAKATTFSDVGTGKAFWYENSCGLVEIAVNQGRADQALCLSIGDPVAVVETAG
jgi:S-adenosylmethionine hydrolase